MVRFFCRCCAEQNVVDIGVVFYLLVEQRIRIASQVIQNRSSKKKWGRGDPEGDSCETEDTKIAACRWRKWINKPQKSSGISLATLKTNLQECFFYVRDKKNRMQTRPKKNSHKVRKDGRTGIEAVVEARCSFIMRRCIEYNSKPGGGRRFLDHSLMWDIVDPVIVEVVLINFLGNSFVEVVLNRRGIEFP
uniref:Cytochrome P450 n=1 Tax=Haemonchus contortus TaxID=6289 RepID=A0A7I4YKD2_HAECO